MTHEKGFKLVTISQKKEALKEACELLYKKLREYNVSKRGAYPEKKEIAFMYYDDNNNLIGGVFALWFEAIAVVYIDILWVDKAYRHQGLGTKLLQKIEEWARDKNAMYTKVNSDTFQAPEFYLKNGYEVVAKLPIKIKGLSNQHDYLLIKYL
jgi:GNAT superfamily N-acetyltransferase